MIRAPASRAAGEPQPTAGQAGNSTVPSWQRKPTSAPRVTESAPTSSAVGRNAQPRQAAIDRYHAGEIAAYDVDESISHYHRAATESWKFCYASGRGTPAEFIADLLDRMTADTGAIDSRKRATPGRHQLSRWRWLIWRCQNQNICRQIRPVQSARLT